MSLIPYWFRNLRRLENRLNRQMIPEEYFVSPFLKDPFFRDALSPLRSAIGWKDIENMEPHEQGLTLDDKKLQVQLDVRDFSPEQIKVKASGNEVLVEGQQEIKKDDGWIRRHFERRFMLPIGFPPEKVECKFANGILTVTAPRQDIVEEPERVIPVEHVKEDKKELPTSDSSK